MTDALSEGLDYCFKICTETYPDKGEEWRKCISLCNEEGWPSYCFMDAEEAITVTVKITLKKPKKTPADIAINDVLRLLNEWFLSEKPVSEHCIRPIMIRATSSRNHKGV